MKIIKKEREKNRETYIEPFIDIAKNDLVYMENFEYTDLSKPINKLKLLNGSKKNTMNQTLSYH